MNIVAGNNPSVNRRESRNQGHKYCSLCRVEAVPLSMMVGIPPIGLSPARQAGTPTSTTLPNQVSGGRPTSSPLGRHTPTSIEDIPKSRHPILFSMACSSDTSSHAPCSISPSPASPTPAEIAPDIGRAILARRGRWKQSYLVHQLVLFLAVEAVLAERRDSGHALVVVDVAQFRDGVLGGNCRTP